MVPAKAAFVRRAQALSPRFSVSESGPESLIETLRRKETRLATRSTARPATTPSVSTITTALSSCASTVVTVCVLAIPDAQTQLHPAPPETEMSVTWATLDPRRRQRWSN
jgi:hypothetical protein